LFFGSDDEHGEDGQHGTIHRHRYAGPIEWNALKQDGQVFYRVDGDARLAHVPHHSGVVAIEPAMRRQIKSYGQAPLARREAAPIKSVRFTRRGKARVLPERPGSAGVHGGAGAPYEGKGTGKRIQIGQQVQIGACVQRFTGQTIRGLELGRRSRGFSSQLLLRHALPLLEVGAFRHENLGGSGSAPATRS
jgi:hypothetical protein